MKVVHEVNQLDHGGVERVVRSIVRYDKENEHTILTYKDGTFRPFLEEVGAKIVLAGDEDVDLEADIIHIHSGGGISQLAKQLGGQFPIIETIHSPIRSPMGSDIITQRVGVCEAVSRLNDSCRTIYNGLEYDMLDTTEDRDSFRANLGIQEDAIVVGRVGRIGFDKGMEEWLLSCYYLQKEGFKVVPLVVGGEARNAERYLGRLKLMAASLPVKGVLWAGPQDHAANWYSAMDIFLYPSRTEGFGLVFAEALYHGLPIVTYKTEVNTDCFGGYALMSEIEKGIPGLVDNVKKIIRSPELQSELSGNGYGFVGGDYEAERMSLEYQELYDECVNRNPERQSQSQKTEVLIG